MARDEWVVTRGDLRARREEVVRGNTARKAVCVTTRRVHSEARSELAPPRCAQWRHGRRHVSRSSHAWGWFARLPRVLDLLTRVLASALFGNFLSLPGKRMRTSELPDGQKRVLLKWGSGYAVASRASGSRSVGRDTASIPSNAARDRDSAVSSDTVPCAGGFVSGSVFSCRVSFVALFQVSPCVWRENLRAKTLATSSEF